MGNTYWIILWVAMGVAFLFAWLFIVFGCESMDRKNEIDVDSDWEKKDQHS
jgi:hypothetical protein